MPRALASFESQQRIARVVFALVLISVPLIGLVLYFTLRTPRASPNAAPPAAAESPTAQPVPEPALPAGAATAPAPGAPITSPPVGRPPAAPGTSATPNAKAQPMRLELRPTGDCWIRLTVDGQPVLARLMHAGETEVREIRDTAVIDVGNAGTFAYSINGRPGKSLGAEGEVRTARISRDTLAQYVQ